MAEGGRFEVLYDGGCGLCQRTVAWLRWADVSRRLTFSDIDRDWDRLVRQHPALDVDACREAMHVLAPDGSISAGFDGFRTLARVVPGLWPVWPILYVPGMPFVGRRVYAYVARHRSTSCKLPEVRRT